MLNTFGSQSDPDFCDKHKDQMLECNSCRTQAIHTQALVEDNWFAAEVPFCQDHAQRDIESNPTNYNERDETGEGLCGADANAVG